MSTAALLLLLCLAVFTEVSYQKPSVPNDGTDVNFCESRYNCYEKKHTLCELGHKCSQGPRCKDFKPVPLTEDDKKLILDVHNKYRSDFALGNEKRSLDGKPWPSAANMREFVWDEELEFYAQCWANQCPVGHSPCNMKTDGLWTGENLSWATYDDNIAAIKRLYDEAENASTAIVDDFQESVGEYKIGHFTQLIFANTSQLGCARSKYYFAKFRRQAYILVCEYAFAGNWLGEPIYKKGTPCSACPQGSECHKKYKGLCTTEPSISKEPNICKFSTDKDCQPILGKVSKVKGTTEKPEQSTTKKTKETKETKEPTLDKLCSLLTDSSYCSQLRKDDELICHNNQHSVDCILNIEETRADFGRITAEEALVAAKFVNNVVVVGEFRSDSANDDSEYATVVLVRSDYTGGFKNLRGKKYCHPGFKFDEVVTEFVLKEFENTVLKDNGAQGCSNAVDSGTVLEKEVKALSEFFGPSCRPGPWVGLEDFDNKFYQQYPRLCELCVSNNKCTVQPGAAPFMQSLHCLVNGGGDIAVTTINTVYEFFNRSENKNKIVDYQYLCRNGEFSTIGRACTWTKQPLNLIVANRDKAESIIKKLEGWLSKHVINTGPMPFSKASERFELYLKAILFPSENKYNKIKFLPKPKSLKEYIEGYRTIPSARESAKCNQNLKWCTVSNAEQQKCEWLAQASLNRAIQPVLTCVQSLNTVTCLEDIKNDKADIVTSDAHYGYIARKKGLGSLAYPETARESRIQPIVVIKNINELNIERFENLKTRKACIPVYGGIEWLSFINTAHDHGALSKSQCDYDDLISDFVGDSCMPGAHVSEHKRSTKADKDKLCSLCAPAPYEAPTVTTCNADNTNQYYGNVGALKCLQESGDYAVITKGGDYSNANIDAMEFRVLCKNGSLASYVGLDVDESCVLTDIVDSEVVSKRNSPKNADIGIVLLNFEKRFGTDRVKSFEVFNTFSGTLDLLFKDSTPGLAPVHSDNKHIRNYVDLFSHVDKCTEKGDDSGSDSTVLPSTGVTLNNFPLLLVITGSVLQISMYPSSYN